ncbi:hypothetical protein RHOFW510R12_12905 [Rhodanobacter sp. FW510-R12]|uniref:hypothetical protein n=1 Tax=unclassified Rhodanobacter TaxID=2621553 RepID=UPI0007A9A8E2|nr:MULTISPECIES: hypothetical protein [unclassified Rhodanobacter]KZC16752.1 hypothetical protein RHOFW104R8_14265 [Rhodanobacter sp. FW104-R8]KZC27733.1 hypothetical protein RhoFW510T8_14520 [Rhodanobacter sp. FW510-T8]KZC30104.1 hypothetical protein RhoFW510R10_03380 [Rhodanobacter sp. FW510-R10]
MHRKTLFASALAVLIAGSASFVMAQNTPPPPSAPHAVASRDMHVIRGDRGHGMRMHGFDHRRSGVIGDLRGLERLYMQAGRSKEMASVYNDVLARSQDPRVRDYVYHRLARLQAQPANVDQAIATLRKGLDENLADEAKMRAAWQQRAGEAAPAAR